MRKIRATIFLGACVLMAFHAGAQGGFELSVTPELSGSTMDGRATLFLGGYRLQLAGNWRSYATVLRDPFDYADSSLSASSITDARLSLSPLGFSLVNKGTLRADLGLSYIFRYNKVETSGNFSMDLDEYGRLDQSFRQDGTLTTHGLLLDLDAELGFLSLGLAWMPLSGFSFTETADFRPIVTELASAMTSGAGHVFLDADIGIDLSLPSIKAKGAGLSLGFGYLLWQTTMNRLSLGEVIYSGGVLSGTISSVESLTRIHQLRPALNLEISIGGTKARIGLVYLISLTEDVSARSIIRSYAPTLSLGISS